jgi:hypothetical protein
MSMTLGSDTGLEAVPTQIAGRLAMLILAESVQREAPGISVTFADLARAGHNHLLFAIVIRFQNQRHRQHDDAVDIYAHYRAD